MSSGKRKRHRITTASLSANQATSFRLLDLPLELRQQIFATFFRMKHSHRACTRDCKSRCARHEKSFKSILLVNHQVHSEAWPYFAECCTLVFKTPDELANNLFASMSLHKLSRFKHLTRKGDTRGLVHSPLSFTYQGQEVTFPHTDLKDMWDRYDFISHLDTFTFEAYSTSTWRTDHIAHFYSMVPVMVQFLLRRSAATSRLHGTTTKQIENSQYSNPTVVYDWVLEIGAFKDPQKTIESCIVHRICLYQNQAKPIERMPDTPDPWLDRLPCYQLVFGWGSSSKRKLTIQMRQRSTVHNFLLRPFAQYSCPYDGDGDIVQCFPDASVDTSITEHSVVSIGGRRLVWH